MSEVSTQVNPQAQVWIRLKDMAKEVSLTPSAIRQAFNNHPAIKEKHYKVLPKGTEKGCEAWVTRDGLALLKFRKPIFKGNQHVESFEVSKEGAPTSQALIQAQDQTALAMAELMNDPIVKLRFQQIQTEKRLDRLEAIQNQALAGMEALPAPTVSAPEFTSRQKVRKLTYDYASGKGVEVEWVWNNLYTQLYYRCGINVSARAKKAGISKIQAVEEAGLMEDLYAIATEILK